MCHGFIKPADLKGLSLIPSSLERGTIVSTKQVAKSLVAVKAKYGEKVVETATSFVVNDHGKYRPNITFVLPKDFSGDPLKYRADDPSRKMIAAMGVDFGTGEEVVEALFGDFWLSKAGKPHFRPKSPQVATHVLVRADWGAGAGGSRTRGRWQALPGAAYFRRASSNGGGTGYDYHVLPIGYYVVVSDEELDGDAVVTADFAARAKAVRSSFAAFSRTQADKAAADAEAKAAVEDASRQAKATLIPRLVTCQRRLEQLRVSDPNTSYFELTLGEVMFVFGWGDKLYTEANVAEVERNISNWEVKLANIQRRPLFEVFAPRFKPLGLSLQFEGERVKWSGEPSWYDGFTYTSEGLEAFEADLVRKEEEAAKKAREEAAAKAKASAEAEAEVLGLPREIRIWKRTGGATNCGMGWVIAPDGFDRERDGLENDNPRRAARYDEGYLVWKQILPGELVLAWRKAFTAAEHEFKVVHLPSGGLTEAQLERVAEIQQELEDTWAGRRGMASGLPSPPVGRGWGLGNFETPPTPRQALETSESDSFDDDTLASAKPVDMKDALQRLQDRFNG